MSTRLGGAGEVFRGCPHRYIESLLIIDLLRYPTLIMIYTVFPTSTRWVEYRDQRGGKEKLFRKIDLDIHVSSEILRYLDIHVSSEILRYVQGISPFPP